jgi:hypothetical protein
MSLEKAIKSGKEHRKPYYGSAAFDGACRPGKACGCCRGNRFYAIKKALIKAEYNEQENETNTI